MCRLDSVVFLWIENIQKFTQNMNFDFFLNLALNWQGF